MIVNTDHAFKKDCVCPMCLGIHMEQPGNRQKTVELIKDLITSCKINIGKSKKGLETRVSLSELQEDMKEYQHLIKYC